MTTPTPTITTAGKLLTPAMIERAVRDAEAGFPGGIRRPLVPNPLYKGPGRPHLKGSTGESPRKTVRLPEAELRAAERRARTEHTTVSAVLRRSLIRYARGT